MSPVIDRLAVEIFNTHIDSLSAARRLAERLVSIFEVEEGRQLTLLSDIRLALVEVGSHRLLRDTYHLTPLEAVLLEHLIRREMLSLEAVMTLTQANNLTCRVVISRLRRKTGLPIINYRGEGYALRGEARRALLAKLNEGDTQ